MRANLAQTSAQTDLTTKNVDVADSQMRMNEINAEKSSASAKETEENTRLLKKQQDKIEIEKKRASEEYKRSKRDNEIQDSRRDLDKKLAPADAVMDRIEQGAGVFGTAIRSLFRGKSGGSPRRVP